MSIYNNGYDTALVEVAKMIEDEASSEYIYESIDEYFCAFINKKEKRSYLIETFD